MKSITICDIKFDCSDNILPSFSDVAWVYGKWTKNASVPGWNGFMEQATSGKHYECSKIVCLPFINAPPSDADTVFTSLLAAKEKCESLNLKSCIVTFDQSLYWKARDMVMNSQNPELSDVIVRLGGFHLLMSFMGAVGTIMAGSGLKDLFCVIYAENSVEKMLSGHAYSRAARAHILAHAALSSLVLEQLELTNEESSAVEKIIVDGDKSIVLRAHENSKLYSVRMKLKNMLCKVESNGPTSKLWVQYLRMITLLKDFIQAERMGYWNLHVDTIIEMLPYFHAAGHFKAHICIIRIW